MNWASLLTGRGVWRAADGGHCMAHRRCVPNCRCRRWAATECEAADFPALVEAARQSSSMKGNPITLTQDELTGVLQEAL